MNMSDEDVDRVVRPGLHTLSPRERAVVEARLGLDGRPRQTLAQVGKERCMSREKVRQIEEGAFRKLRRYSLDIVVKRDSGEPVDKQQQT